MPDVVPLAVELRYILNRLNRRMRHQQLGHDLTVAHLSVLDALLSHGPLGAGDLAVKERVRPPSMSRIIAALERHALVVRRANPADRRQSLLELTDLGRSRITVEKLARDRWLAQQLNTLTQDEQELLHNAAAILNRLAGQ